MPFNDRHRYLAMRRAVKMNKLFKEDNFDAIMTALYKDEDDPARKTDFDAACDAAGLTPEEKAWLWNYLEHCNRTYWDPVQEAAQTGW